MNDTKIPDQYLLNERLKVEADTSNFAGEDSFTVTIKLCDENDKILKKKTVTEKIGSQAKNKTVKYSFTTKDIAEEEPKVDIKKIFCVKAFIDYDGDGEVDIGYDEEIVFNIVGDVDVIVLVAGTTDPFNLSDSKGKFASSFAASHEKRREVEVGKSFEESCYSLKETQHMEGSLVSNLCEASENSKIRYSEIPTNYWSDSFLDGINNEINLKIHSTKILTFHEWSGDNTETARKNAAQYLVDRICGADKKKAILTKSYQEREVNFHFIGHSHGGNVINEVTRAINENTSWSENWKVKTITYLSTPFFNTIHQPIVNEKVFLKDAKILHLYNDYDLTQRVIADFTLHQLAGIGSKIDFTNLNKSLGSLKIPSLSKILGTEEKKDNNIEENNNSANILLDVVLSISKINIVIKIVSILIERAIELYDEKRYRSKEDAKEIYEEMSKFLLIKEDKITTGGVAKVLKDIKKAVEQLNKQDIKFVAQDTPNHTTETTRSVIPDDAKGAIDEIMNIFIIDIEALVKVLNNKQKEDRVKSEDEFDMLWLLEDILSSDFIKSLIDFINLDNTIITNINNIYFPEKNISKDKKIPSMWYIVISILSHNIKKYDDTYVEPNKQFENSFLKNSIKGVDITKLDSKHNDDYKKTFDIFISKLEGLEKKVYEGDVANRSELLELLVTLLANDKKVENSINNITILLPLINLLKFFTNDNTDVSIEHIYKIIDNIERTLNERRASSMVTKSVSNFGASFHFVKVDDLYSLAYNSHNLSKDTLHEWVISFLKENTYANKY